MPDPRWRRRGGKPPWWPEGEGWPPEGRMGPEAWRGMRGRFMWRIGCFFLLMTVIFVSVVALLGWLIGSAIGAAPTILIGLVALLVLAMIGRAIRSAAAPVGDLIEASGRVEAGDFSTRVPESGPGEVRALARAFNNMSARLEETEQQRRSALADVSHELRTPLTVIQGNLEALLDGVYPADADHIEPILAETRILERLIEDLRTLALVEAGSLVLHREPSDLGALPNEVAGGHRSQADSAGIGLRVTVTDGMPPDQLDRVFDRFYRSPDSPGSGLGLPIARSLVEAHGGSMTATSEPERGTTIRFTLPSSSPEDPSVH